MARTILTTTAVCAALLAAGRAQVALAVTPIPPQNTSLYTCQTTAAKEVAAYSAAVQATMAKCLKAIAGDKIKKAQPISVATAKTCVKALEAYSSPTKQLSEKAWGKFALACSPGNAKVKHAIDDVVDGDNSGGQTVTGQAIRAERLGMSCDVGVFSAYRSTGIGDNTGVGGRLGNMTEWLLCLLFSAEREALRQVHVQYPHGHEWLQEVKPTIETLALTDLNAADAMNSLWWVLRWVDYGDEVYDRVTGLYWEKKTTDGGIHDKDNTYTWSTVSPWGPTGTAFTTFLNTLNGGATGVGGCTSADGVKISGHCNWRLPTVAELQTILWEPYSITTPCSKSPCIDETVFGPTQSSFYWSASTYAPVPNFAWYVVFGNGNVGNYYKTNSHYVRAVRSGL